MKILISEDDFLTRKILGKLLTSWGYEIVAIANGRETLQVLSDPKAPQIALLDWVMPDIEGVQVCQQIRQIKVADPPYIIILTAKASKSDIISGLDAGANDYIVKPYHDHELLARIRVGERVLAMQAEKNFLIGELKEALASLKTLSMLLPICASCKKIRDDQGYWNQIESYLAAHSDIQFSHSICPECAKKLYPELY